MPNGGDISDVDFRDLDAQFSPLDEALSAFAEEKRAQYVRNYHDVPSRRIDYLGADGVHHSLVFSSVTHRPQSNERLAHPEFTISVAAWQGDGAQRRVWHHTLQRRKSLPGNDELDELLQEMFVLVNAVRDEDLTHP